MSEIDENQDTDEQEPDTFPREYVEQLRSEAAEHRTGRTAAEQRADAAMTRLRAAAMHSAARDVLADPTDLQWDDSMADEEGWPDPGAITAAATALVEAKPHMGRVRGDVGQGFRGDAESVSLVEALRGL